MQALTAAQRATAVNTLADLLVSREKFILDANAKDLAEAQKSGLAKPLLSRLSLNSAKLKNLSIGLKQIAEDSHKVSAKWKTNWAKKNGELIEIAFWKSLRKLHLFCCRKILWTCPRKHNGELLGGNFTAKWSIYVHTHNNNNGSVVVHMQQRLARCFNNIMKSPSNFTLQQKLTPEQSAGQMERARAKQVEDKRQLSSL